jgi:hypothetical protein
VTLEPIQDIASSSVYRRAPKAIFTDLDGETALFQTDTCEYLVLNATGSAIWELIGVPCSLQDICRQLVDNYDVQLELCLHETSEWLKNAVDREVVLVDQAN